ncbi:MAG: hypothetical protein ACO3CV_05080 [Steroidobacteraceae bacterium]
MTTTSIPHRRVRGRLRYTSDAPGREGQERGREWFTLTVNTDGRRSLRAYTEIDDVPNVMRDVTLSLDASWRPTDAFVRLQVGDRFMGSSWFRFSEREAECEGYTAAEGRFSQRWPLSRPLDGFGTHPIQADSWLTSLVDLSRAQRETLPLRGDYDNLLMCSLDHRGASGPMLMAFPNPVKLAFIGTETIHVAAGVFEALHYRFAETTDDGSTETRNEPGRHPPYDLWCTADGDRVCLLATVGGYMMTRYELVELERG